MEVIVNSYAEYRPHLLVNKVNADRRDRSYNIPTGGTLCPCHIVFLLLYDL